LKRCAVLADGRRPAGRLCRRLFAAGTAAFCQTALAASARRRIIRSAAGILFYMNDR